MTGGAGLQRRTFGGGGAGVVAGAGPKHARKVRAVTLRGAHAHGIGDTKAALAGLLGCARGAGGARGERLAGAACAHRARATFVGGGAGFTASRAAHLAIGAILVAGAARGATARKAHAATLALAVGGAIHAAVGFTHAPVDTTIRAAATVHAPPGGSTNLPGGTIRICRAQTARRARVGFTVLAAWAVLLGHTSWRAGAVDTLLTGGTLRVAGARFPGLAAAVEALGAGALGV